MKHKTVLPEDINYALAEVASAKNRLRRTHGFSPSQWLFGGDPNMGDAMIDQNPELHLAEELKNPSEEWLRRHSIRQAAREAFIQSQADDAVKRALLGRPRADKEHFEPGDYVYIFRVDRIKGIANSRQNVGQWIGPGVVIGKEGTSSYGVSRGGRCLLCAKEHMRSAETGELGGLFQARSLQRDLHRLVENVQRDNQHIFMDATDEIDTHMAVPEAEVQPRKRIRFKSGAMKPRATDGEPDGGACRRRDGHWGRDRQRLPSTGCRAGTEVGPQAARQRSGMGTDTRHRAAAVPRCGG